MRTGAAKRIGPLLRLLGHGRAQQIRHRRPPRVRQPAGAPGPWRRSRSRPTHHSPSGRGRRRLPCLARRPRGRPRVPGVPRAQDLSRRPGVAADELDRRAPAGRHERWRHPMMGPTDGTLAMQLAPADADAHGEVVSAVHIRRGRELWTLARRLGLAGEEADDVVQEALARLWQELRRGGVVNDPEAWAFRLAPDAPPPRRARGPPQAAWSGLGPGRDPADRCVGRGQPPARAPAGGSLPALPVRLLLRPDRGGARHLRERRAQLGLYAAWTSGNGTSPCAEARK